jgi:hypothetical protein
MSIFKFKYDTNAVEVQEEVIETELSNDLLEAFDSKVHCFTEIFGAAAKKKYLKKKPLPDDKEGDTMPSVPKSKVEEQRVEFANPRAAAKAQDVARPNRSVVVRDVKGNVLAKHPANKPGLRSIIKPLADAGHRVTMESVDGETTILESIDDLDNFLNEASKLAPTDAQYKPQQFPKGKVFKGSYGERAALATSEPKQFVAPSIWGLTPKEPTGQAKAQARQVTFGDHSKDDTEELASAQHGPAINHERFSVTMIPGKGFSVVDHLGVIVKGKDGNELTGYRKQGAAKIAMKDHERMHENVIASFTLGQLKEAYEESFVSQENKND